MSERSEDNPGIIPRNKKWRGRSPDILFSLTHSASGGMSERSEDNPCYYLVGILSFAAIQKWQRSCNTLNIWALRLWRKVRAKRGQSLLTTPYLGLLPWFANWLCIYFQFLWKNQQDSIQLNFSEFLDSKKCTWSILFANKYYVLFNLHKSIVNKIVIKHI